MSRYSRSVKKYFSGKTDLWKNLSHKRLPPADINDLRTLAFECDWRINKFRFKIAVNVCDHVPKSLGIWRMLSQLYSVAFFFCYYWTFLRYNCWDELHGNSDFFVHEKNSNRFKWPSDFTLEGLPIFVLFEQFRRLHNIIWNGMSYLPDTVTQFNGQKE